MTITDTAQQYEGMCGANTHAHIHVGSGAILQKVYEYLMHTLTRKEKAFTEFN